MTRRMRGAVAATVGAVVVGMTLPACGSRPGRVAAVAPVVSTDRPPLAVQTSLHDEVASMSPTVILQFPLVPSGLKAKFPQASGVVTVVLGSPSASTFDTVTVTVEHMPPNTTFTMFYSELANAPFGNVQYVADLTTRGDGTGDVTFNAITFVAFAMDSNNPGTTTGKQGPTSGVNLDHFGMWFSSIDVARKVLGDKSLKATIFDGGSPPAHAGPQAMTDGRSDPVL